MAYPTITFHNQDGSDTQASGAGPATALYGTGASIDGTTSIDLSADSPDFSGLSFPEGSAVLWVNTTLGRKFFAITEVNDTTKVVTVAVAATGTESGLTWGLGGQRKDLNAASNRVLFSTDILPGWTVDLQETGTDYTLTSYLNCAVSGGTGYSTLHCIHLTSSSTTRPTITTSTNSTSLIGLNAVSGWHLSHLKFTNTATTKASMVTYVSNAYYIQVRDCVFDGSTSGLVPGQGPYLVEGCEFTNCSTAGFNIASSMSHVLVHGCYFHDCTGSGILSSNTSALFVFNSTFARCAYGIRDTDGGELLRLYVFNCAFAHQTADGIELSYSTVADSVMAFNCIFYGNAAYGIDTGTMPAGYQAGRLRVLNCAFGANVTADVRGSDVPQLDSVTLTGTPFTDGTDTAGHDDWTLNNAAGGGAACRDAGYPATVPGATGTNYLDLGAWQITGVAGGLLQGNKRAHKQ